MSLYYVEQGEGEPLVLLHGNGEDHTYFKKQMEPFSEKFRVIAIDTRGHGKSPRGDAPFTFEQFAEDLKEFFDEHELTGVNLLGFSDGGNIALTFALKYQRYLKRLILNGANLSPKGLNSVYFSFLAARYRTAAFLSLFDKKAALKKEMLALMVKQPNISSRDLGKLAVPTLVIAGTQDLILREHTELIYQNIYDAELCFIEGTHFIAANASEEFNSRVLKFLRKKAP